MVESLWPHFFGPPCRPILGYGVMLPRQQEGTAESQAEQRTQKWFIVIVLLLNITQVSSILRKYFESVIILSRNTSHHAAASRFHCRAPYSIYRHVTLQREWRSIYILAKSVLYCSSFVAVSSAFSLSGSAAVFSTSSSSFSSGFVPTCSSPAVALDPPFSSSCGVSDLVLSWSSSSSPAEVLSSLSPELAAASSSFPASAPTWSSDVAVGCLVDLMAVSSSSFSSWVGRGGSGGGGRMIGTLWSLSSSSVGGYSATHGCT